jgi:hypothetical protein
VIIINKKWHRTLMWETELVVDDRCVTVSVSRPEADAMWTAELIPPWHGSLEEMPSYFGRGNTRWNAVKDAIAAWRTVKLTALGL